jgi:hypothetical protein
MGKHLRSNETGLLNNQTRIAWSPQKGPQQAFIACPVFQILFGGSRGGGKSDAILGEWISHADLYGADASGLIIRRERTQLIDLIERSKIIYSNLGWRYEDVHKLWRSPNGARLRFAYLERDSDANGYQGHSYTRLYVEEAGTFPRPEPIYKLMATLRSGNNVPVGIRLTANPGGPGHNWVKAKYIDPAPQGWKIHKEIFDDPFGGESIERDWVFIPSTVKDNKYLGQDYIANLQMVGSPQLVRAWLEGDWNVIEGAFFSEFGKRHVIEPFEIPEHWTRFISMDWGSAAPFSVGFYSVSDGSIEGIEKGCLVKYREWYGTREPGSNVGLKLTAEEVGQGIVERMAEDERLDDAVLDPSAFARDGGPSHAERIYEASGNVISFRRADNKRVSRKGAMGGWDNLRARLKPEPPMILFFSTCTETIRTIPMMQHDVQRPEDVDSDGEDHAADETRYACMSRPFIKKAKDKKELDVQTIKGRSDRTIMQMVEERKRLRLQQEDY